MQDSRVMKCVEFALATTLILSLFPLGIESQNPGCSFQSLELDKCLNQEGQYMFLEPCCKALNQALRVGFHCLCSVFSTNAPQLTTIFSLSLSSCYIMVPPLSMCRDLGTTPVSLPIPPNNPTKDIRTAQQTAPLVPLPPTAPQAIGAPLDPSSPLRGNATVVEQESHPSNNVTSMLHVVKNEKNESSSGSEEAHLFRFHSWLLSILAVYSLVF